jgi:hypothetical protein
MNAYTTIEESKQLIEAGLDVNTADMYFPDYTEITEIREKPRPVEYIDDKNYPPCWSLAALLNIIDNNDLVYDISNDKNREFKILVYEANYISQEVKFHHTEHSIVDMITWLLENNYIKSNKNE